MNEIDPYKLLPLCALYGIQNQIFQQYVPIWYYKDNDIKKINKKKTKMFNKNNMAQLEP